MPAKRSAPRGRNALALAAALLLGACAPRAELPAGPAPALPAAPSVRVGLLVDTPSVRVSSPSRFQVVEAGSGRVLETLAASETVTVAAEGTALVATAAGREVARSAAGPLLFRPVGEDGFVSIGGKLYRGEALVRAGRPGMVTAVNTLDLETYLLGVVPKEIGRVGPELLEAAKAQAVAARTYAVKYLGRREALGFDVFATVQDQVYGGVEAEFDPVSRAVLETAGEILTHEGEPIEAYYHSTCAGRTAAIQQVWNAEPVPYLISVVDVNPETGEAWDVKSSRFRWTQRWTAEQLTGILNRTLADSLPRGVGSIGELRDLKVLERTESGRIHRLRISTTAGDFFVGKDRIRWIFLTPAGVPLNSSLFDVEVVRGPGGEVTEVIATGGGWGHGIGMCQVGAMGRARAGQEYREILRAYYPGTELRDLY